MKIWVKGETWKEVFDLSEALLEIRQSKTALPVKIAVAGSGGKTSLIGRLAREQKQLGKKVLVLTTTHMYEPTEYGVLTGYPADIRKAIERDGLAVVGKRTGNGKITWPGDRIYREIAPYADLVLIEADGSKGLPVKFPKESEPVIPEDTDLILVVSGLDGLGKQGGLVCHRWELAKTVLLGAKPNDLSDTAFEPAEWRFGPEDLSSLLQEGYLKRLQHGYSGIPVIPVLNQADNEALQETGRQMIDALNEKRGIVMSLI